MPREHLSMRKIFEVMRLRREQGLSHSKIAAACGIGVGTVHDYLRRAREPRMRQAHKAGEKLFVDYAGQTIGITDRVT